MGNEPRKLEGKDGEIYTEITSKTYEQDRRNIMKKGWGENSQDTGKAELAVGCFYRYNSGFDGFEIVSPEFVGLESSIDKFANKLVANGFVVTNKGSSFHASKNGFIVDIETKGDSSEMTLGELKNGKYELIFPKNYKEAAIDKTDIVLNNISIILDNRRLLNDNEKNIQVDYSKNKFELNLN